MTDYLKSNYIIEEKVRIQEIPAIIFRPKEINKPIPTIIFYHGWSSNKETQRMRGFILASVGYQVVIPDAVYHGERNPLTNYGQDIAIDYFWDVIFSNIDESGIIAGEMISKYNADPEKIAVAGNSMGGFTAGGVFTHNENIKALIVFNGSCGWENFNKNFDVSSSEELTELKNKVNKKDPMNNLNLLKDRPILMLHGDSDVSVPIDSQRIFYEKLQSMYNDKERIKLIEYLGLNHVVTTNMMEESINWLGRYL
jgi:dienelactone hydrolase